MQKFILKWHEAVKKRHQKVEVLKNPNNQINRKGQEGCSKSIAKS